MSDGVINKAIPLSAHALAELRYIAKDPVPYQAVNPGVAHKLVAHAFVSVVRLPSPFKTHKGANIDHLQITDAGREHIK